MAAKNTQQETTEHYVVGMRDDQWQLVVDALKYVRARTQYAEMQEEVIDQFCREHTRKSIDAVIDEIASNVSTLTS